jgi:hypothetical protein
MLVVKDAFYQNAVPAGMIIPALKLTDCYTVKYTLGVKHGHHCKV